MCMREKLLVVGTSLAVFLGICSLYLPSAPPPQPPAAPDMRPLQSCTKPSDCPAPQTCLSGTCVLPARAPARVPFGSSEAYARWEIDSLK